ncbi:hypothetical protein JK386_06565 [Nocardioides sp. zg-536]|uniref:Uncharacterized protein n=1 Tax=Nocardioides faecalis TaxID=2803858 RepID=A0A938Y985_9ACTN|nr:hypothetical protein [Nocardioides faecalis]
MAVAPCLLLGAAVSLATVALHDYLWGLALGLAATIATLAALPPGWWARLPFALGWVAMVAVLTPERREGDLVVSNDVAGYLLLGAAAVVLAAGVASTTRPRRRNDAASPDRAT